MKDDKEEIRQRMRLVGVFMTIPFVLAVPPVVGWMIGNWLDKKLDTHPFLMYLFLIFGFVAGIREFYRILKKYGNGQTK